MLEFIGSQYGWKIVFSPKCTPEIAGIGIEYDWANAKNRLNGIPLQQRKGYKLFKDKCLSDCFSSTGALPKYVVRGNAKQARTYIIGYLLTHAELAAKGEVELSAGLTSGEVSLEALQQTVSSVPMQVIEKSKRSYKGHRGIAMFDMNSNTVRFVKKEEVK